MTCLGSCAWAGGQASSGIRHQTNDIVEKTRRIFRVLPLPFQSNLCPRRPEVCQPAPVPHWIEIRGDGPKAIRVRRAWRCHCRINTSCRVDNRHSLVMKTGNYFATAGKLETVNREPVSALPPDADMCSAAAQFGPEADSAARTSVARGVLIGPVIVPLNSTFDRTQLEIAFHIAK
jgi:hypothetical protein